MNRQVELDLAKARIAELHRHAASDRLGRVTRDASLTSKVTPGPTKWYVAIRTLATR